MRVIAGIHKGRPLKATAKTMTRPTSDKVKEALFQHMGPFFNGGTCLDLYAGSGSLGIEALSRGMDRSVFVDKDPWAIQIVHQNIKRLKLDNLVHVFRSDAKHILRKLHQNEWQFQYIFLDPPYDRTDYSIIIQKILELDLLAEDGVISCEHAASQQMPDFSGSLTIMKEKTYGTTTGITIYTNKQ